MTLSSSFFNLGQISSKCPNFTSIFEFIVNYYNSPLSFPMCSIFIFYGNTFHFATGLLLRQVDSSLSRVIPISSISLAIGLLIFIINLPIAPTNSLFLFNKFNPFNDTSLYVNKLAPFSSTRTSYPLTISTNLLLSFIKST